MIMVILFLLGLCFGSFVNAFVWRLHEKQRAKSKEQRASLSITKGRSMCVHCRHVLGWHDLIPVISWLMLGGKCRYCKKPISKQYPIIELITAVLFVASYIFWPLAFTNYQTIQFILWLGVLVSFMALIVYDIKWMILPDKLVLITTIGAGLLAFIRITERLDSQSFLNPFWGVVCIAGLFYVLFQISKGKWIGGGDVKLGVSLGLLVGGPSNALLTVFLASVLGSLAGLPMLLKNRKALHARIPFGPFLIMATIIVFLFGTSIVHWYKTTLLISI